MKKIILIFILMNTLSAFAGDILHASVEYNAETARKEAFKNVTYKIPAEKIKDNIFDKNIDENKNALKYKLALPDRDIKIYNLPFSKTYGVSYKKNPQYTYFYWHSSGYLKAVAIESAPAKDKYPITIYRYNPYGDLSGVSFQVSPDEEYIYNKDGTLNCHWVGDEAYDENGRRIGNAEDVKLEAD